MRAVSLILIAGALAQGSNPSLGASASLGVPSAVRPATTAAPKPTTPKPATPKPTVSSGPQIRGIPIGTSTGIIDSDVACAQAGYVGAACGLPNVPSIYNPNPALRYQTQYSDNALSLLQATNRYTASGARIVTGNPSLDFGTYDIPTQNQVASGVATTSLGGFPVQQTTSWFNNGLQANAWTPSASNAVLPNSVAFAQANVVPWTTTPVNTLTGAGFGYSVVQGYRPTGLGQAPVTQWGQPLNTFGTLGTWSTKPFFNYYSQPGVIGAPSQLGIVRIL